MHKSTLNKKRFSFLTTCLTLFAFLFVVNIGWGQLSITSTGTAFTQNFDGMGTSGTATLPTGFKIGTDWSTGTTATTLAYGTTGTGAVTSSSSGGTINWANGITGSATDRSLGFLTTGSFTSPRSIMLSITNNTGVTITSISIVFDYEKSRSGSRQFDWTFFHGSTSTATTSATGGDQNYPADVNNTVISNPPLTTSKSFSISGLSIANGSSYYLRWTFTGLAGSTNGQGIGIDNFSIAAANTFYSKSTGNLEVLSNWGTNTDGTGTAPLNFTTSYQVFNIRNNATPTIGAAWTVSGTSSKIIVGDGTNACNFTIPSGFSYTGTADVAANGTLTNQNTTNPTFGTLATNSTIVFAGSSSQTIPSGTFSNLTINNSSGVSLTSNLTVSGTLTVTSGALNVGANTLSIASSTSGSGAINFDNGSTFNFTGGSFITVTNPIALTSGTVIFNYPFGAVLTQHLQVIFREMAA